MAGLESNQILSQLSNEQWARLQAEVFEPEYGALLIEMDRPSPVVYFPLEGAVLSLTRALENGTSVEVGVVGSEGIGGLAALLDPERFLDRGQVQAVGEFAAVRTATLDEEIGRDARLRAIIFRYINAFLMQVAQTAVCNASHAIEQRLARWLLMMRDRVEQDEMRMTQEFLAIMLGTRTASVNEAVQSLEKDGLIKHARQRITLIDRKGLEAAACECYEIVRRARN